MRNKSEEVWIEFEGLLKKFISIRVSNSQDVEDILQDIFVKLYTNIDKLYGEQKVKAWLYTVTRNAINDYYRRQYQCLDIVEFIEENICNSDSFEPEYIELTACIRPFIDDLPDIYREAIELTEFKGMTQKKMSEYIRIPLSTGKSRVQRARKMIKKMLNDCCTAEFDKYGNVVKYEKKKKTKYC